MQNEDKETHGDNPPCKGKGVEKKDDKDEESNELNLSRNLIPQVPACDHGGNNCRICFNPKYNSKAAYTHQYALYTRVDLHLMVEEMDNQQNQVEDADNPLVGPPEWPCSKCTMVFPSVLQLEEHSRLCTDGGNNISVVDD